MSLAACFTSWEKVTGWVRKKEALWRHWERLVVGGVVVSLPR